nr:MAG TPA: Chromatin modification-related protein [Caudoviricetes sp.]DAT64743.1 MAG TPA: Chromatin modification-related protein [Caudoviricetes sp.]
MIFRMSCLKGVICKKQTVETYWRKLNENP